MENSTLNNEFDFDFDFDLDFNDEKKDNIINNQNISYKDEIIDLRKSEDTIKDAFTTSKNVNLESKDIFDIGNLNFSDYNIDNIDKKETSEHNKTNEDNNFDKLGNKKELSKIKYKNDTNISNINQKKGLSNNNTLNMFYDLEIDDYPDRENLLHLDNINNKSLGSNTKTGFLDKLFSINKKK